MSNKIRYYNSFIDDFVESAHQNFKIADNYKWVRTDLFSRCMSALVYSVAFIASSVYCRIFLHTRFKNSRALRKNAQNGAFIYVPVFCMTSTYQKRRFGKKPNLVIYVDGPFYPDASLSAKRQTALLHDTVYNTMKKRSEKSNCQYIRYEQERNM